MEAEGIEGVEEFPAWNGSRLKPSRPRGGFEALGEKVSVPLRLRMPGGLPLAGGARFDR